MQFSILTLLMFMGLIQSDSLNIAVITQVLVGDKKNDIHIHREQYGLYFAIDSNERFWLTDVLKKQIKSFDNKGRLLYIVLSENPSAQINKMYIHNDYLIALTSDGILYFYNKHNGKLVARQTLIVEHAIFNKAYFFDKYLFLPQDGSPLPNENLYEFVIEVNKSSEYVLSVNVRQLGLIINAYNSDKKNDNYLPIDSSCYTALKGIDQLDFKGQSEDYILIRRESKNEENDFYYLFLKKNHIIKKIGSIPKSITGFVDNAWWGESSVIVGNRLFLMGVKYQDMKYYDNPQKIIISKVDLSNTDKMATMSIQEMLAK